MILKELLNMIHEKQKIGITYRNSEGKLMPIETLFDDIAKIFTKEEIVGSNYEFYTIKSIFASDGVLIVELD